MKSISKYALAGLACAALFVGCQPASTPKEEVKTDTGVSSITSPTDLLTAGTVGSVSVSAGYNNTYATALYLKLADKESDTGYTPIDKDLSGTWVDTGLDLGTKSLKFELANHSGADADSGHVVVSFKDIADLSRTGKTGFTFTIKFVDAPSGSAVGLMPHLRVKSGSDENTVTFADEKWFYKTDAAYFVAKFPFSDFSKPSYGKQTETTIAALAAGTVFNQIDFDIRVAPVADGKFLYDKKYNVILDNVGYY